jgi:glutamate racemase
VTDGRPIAIFDSGIGGLTVLRALRQSLPGESFVYLGDTARLPYGTKSAATVTRYALRAADYLVGQGIKMLVVACNTASAAALPTLKARLPLPVVGVVTPGARTAVRVTRGRVGLIATESTVASGAYEKAVRRLRPEVTVLSRACPLFVPLAEEGWFDHPVTDEVARIYLSDLPGQGIDTLILGCTHYPLLRGAISRAVGDGVRLVDSASAVAEQVGEILARRAVAAPAGSGQVRLLVTDAAARIARIARLILPEHDGGLELVDLPV